MQLDKKSKAAKRMLDAMRLPSDAEMVERQRLASPGMRPVPGMENMWATNEGHWIPDRPKPAFERKSMNNVDLFGAFTMLLTLAIGSFGWEWTRDVPDYAKALEHTYFQGWALFLAWAVWREPKEKPQR